MTARTAPRPTWTLAAALVAAALAGLVGYGLPGASHPMKSGASSASPMAADPPAALPLRDDLTADARRKVVAVTRPPRRFDRPERFETMAGGAATFLGQAGRDSLSQPSAQLSPETRQDFELGNALFDKLWVSAPSSTQASDGLGPLYNARACATCHVRDGRGHLPDGAGSSPSLVLRLMHAGGGDPVYGRQLQDSAVPGQRAEGRMLMAFEPSPVTLAGGEVVTLRRPRIELADLSHGPLDPATGLSPRLAPAMTGLGLIEAVHPADLLSRADPTDADGDGISGRAIHVIDPASGVRSLGRFGWKAEMPSVRAQAAAAFASDLGISTPDRPDSNGDCTAAQTACLSAPNGVQPRLGPVEAPEPVLALVSDYARHLAVPARRDVGTKEVLAGKALFHEIGCATCHRPNLVTRRDGEAGFAFQLIWPYSDLLLHDMGEALADLGGDGGERPDAASRREWRTPPLWAIGLAATVDPRAAFLHDGRARTLQEAILWHGGEGQAARDRYAHLPAPDRRALLTFLESL